MHSKSDNVDIISGYSTNDIINKLIKPFEKRLQEGLETKMRVVIIYLIV